MAAAAHAALATSLDELHSTVFGESVMPLSKELLAELQGVQRKPSEWFSITDIEKHDPELLASHFIQQATGERLSFPRQVWQTIQVRLVAAISLMSSLLCTAQTASANHFAPQIPNTTRPVQANYGQLPLAFEANKGQTDPRVKFVSRGAGYSVFLTSGGMVLSLRPQESVFPVISDTASKAQPTTNKIAGNTPDATMIFTLVGAASNPKAVGEEPLPTKVNYFIGRDPKKWQTSVQTYAKVRYQNVYPGIDLLYYGRANS